MTNPFLDRLARVTQQQKKQSPAYWRSKKQEKEIGKKLNMRPTSASGSQRQKGDMYDPGIARVECKTTGAKSYSLTRADIDKITNASVPFGQLPAMVIEFINAEGRKEMDVALIKVSDLQHYVELLRKELKDGRG